MCFVSSSTDLIELFLLNSWELLGCGQMPLGTRCVCVCVCVFPSVCVHLYVCSCNHVFHTTRVYWCMPKPHPKNFCDCVSVHARVHVMKAVGLSVAYLVVSRRH